MPSDQDAAIFAECDRILRESADLLDRAQRSPSPLARRKPLRSPLARSAPADGGLIHKRHDNASAVTAAAAQLDLDPTAVALSEAVAVALAATVKRLQKNFERQIAKLEKRIAELEHERSSDRAKVLTLPRRSHVVA